MIAIAETLVSDDILKKAFVCNLNACKGACCVDGDSGAPLDADEAQVLANIYPKIKKYLRPEGIAAIEKQGTSVIDSDGDLVTPLNAGQECAYVVFEKGIAACGIENAHKDGVIDYRKPISCHLYPIRITTYDGFDAVNYHEWEICDPACVLGAELQVPLYKFLREAIIRKYGNAYYEELEETSAVLNK